MAIGASVKMGYLPSTRLDLLDGERTVFQTLEDAFPQRARIAVRTLAGCFGFSGDDVEKRARVLSGGENARLVMALMPITIHRTSSCSTSRRTISTWRRRKC